MSAAGTASSVEATAFDDTRPCVGCGMCCNGTLYGLAKVAPGEEDIIRGHGLTIIEVGDKTYFRLPCQKESCGRCTIYETRFEICRSFRCALLKSYHAGDVSLDEARQRVDKALQLLAAVVADDPEAAQADNRKAIRNRLADLGAHPDEPSRRKAAQQLLRIIALDTFLEKWFRNPKNQDGDAAELDNEASNI